MSFTTEQIAELQAKLDKSVVKQRSQAGRQLSYIEGWWAISEANRIFGFDGWHRETIEMRQLGEPHQDVKNLWRVFYCAKVKVAVIASDEKIIIREGTGYGSGIDRDLGSAHESAIKEAETDAMKRALMTFGNPFGLALYDKTQENVETKPDDPVKAAIIASIEHVDKKKKDPIAPWKGPLSKTDLLKKMRAFTADLQLCDDLSMISSCMAGYQAEIDQLKIDLPELWDGEPDGNGFVPLKKRIEDREALLSQDPTRYMKAG